MEREGRHRLDWRDATWRRADSAQRRPRLAGDRRATDRRPLRPSIGCTGSRRPRSFSSFSCCRSGASAIQFSICASSRTATCRRRAASICSSGFASWWRSSACRSSSTSPARADTMTAALVTGYLLCAFTVPMALAAIPGGWLSERLGYRSSVDARLDRRRRRLLDDESLEG